MVRLAIAVCTEAYVSLVEEQVMSSVLHASFLHKTHVFSKSQVCTALAGSLYPVLLVVLQSCDQP